MYSDVNYFFLEFGLIPKTVFLPAASVAIFCFSTLPDLSPHSIFGIQQNPTFLAAISNHQII